MEVGARYDSQVRTNYLPDGGLVHVDASFDSVHGLDKRTRKGSLVALEKVKNWNKVFRKRGEVSSAPVIIEEIRVKAKKYKEKVNNVKKFRRNFCSNDRGFMSRTDYNRMDGDFVFFKSVKKEYEATCSILEKGVSDYLSRWNPSLFGRASHFLRDKKISFANRELITAAILSGDGSGILSGDYALMTNYISAVNFFGFKGCFVCDVIGSKTMYIR